MTQTLVDFSNFLKYKWWMGLLIILALYLSIKYFGTTRSAGG